MLAGGPDYDRRMKIRITCNPTVGSVNDPDDPGYTACAHQSPDGNVWEPVLHTEGQPIEMPHKSEEGARLRVLDALDLAGFKRGDYELVD